jgi:predicted dehydrogenase
VFTGGIDEWLEKGKLVPRRAIIAVSSELLNKVTTSLIKRGVKEILVEKPGGLDFNNIRKVYKVANKSNSNVFVAYNRRFYSSVKRGLEIIKKDGGATSFIFEFTEWSHVIKDLKKDKKVKLNWLLQNSSHVIDLAFFMGGKPKTISTYTSGSLSWHPKASTFAGAGITVNDVLFSYVANWDAPGRWGLEIMTKKHRLIYRPLEKLQIQNLGSTEIKEAKIDNKDDILYKPGIYQQLRSFIGNKRNLCTIDEQVGNLDIYKRILK